MKKIALYFHRNGKCCERLYDDAYACIRYINRYLGAIKDYRIFPRYCTNASLVQIEIETPQGLMHAKIYIPLDANIRREIEEEIITCYLLSLGKKMGVL